MSVFLEGEQNVEWSQSELKEEGEGRHEIEHVSQGHTVSPIRITKFLLLITLTLLGCHFVVSYLAFKVLILFDHSPSFPFLSEIYYTFYQQFHLAQDGNIPTYFSSLNLAVASILLYVIHNTGKKETYHWLYLSIIFIFLSVDESAQVHETFGGLAGNKFNSYLEEVPSFLNWAWMVPYSVLTLCIGLYFLKFTFKLPHKTRNLFYLSGSVYVFAALVLELFESHFDSLYGPENLMNKLLFPCEEILEMVGVILFIYALLDYLRINNKELKISILTK